MPNGIPIEVLVELINAGLATVRIERRKATGSGAVPSVIR
jgi:hypothetical protein